MDGIVRGRRRWAVPVEYVSFQGKELEEVARGDGMVRLDIVSCGFTLIAVAVYGWRHLDLDDWRGHSDGRLDSFGRLLFPG